MPAHVDGNLNLSWFRLIFSNCFAILQTEFNIFGFSVSIWDFFIWSAFVYLLIKIIMYVME